MARTFTLAQLQTKVRQRSDTEGSRHVTDVEIADYLNTAYAELYEILAQSGRHYFESVQAITTSGSATVNLLPDYMFTLRVDYLPSATVRRRLREVQVAELERWPVNGSSATGYRTIGSTLALYSTPPSGQNYEHRYVPACPVLVNPGDTVDGIGGWEELLVVSSAILVGLKEETDVSTLRQQQAELRSRITQAAEDRELLSTGRIIDEDEPQRDEGSFDVRPWWS
jgi:hypothetical protein